MSAPRDGMRVVHRPARKGVAVARLAWRAAWVWGPPAVMLWHHGPGLAALILASTFAASAVVDKLRPEPLGASVKRELGLL